MFRSCRFPYIKLSFVRKTFVRSSDFEKEERVPGCRLRTDCLRSSPSHSHTPSSDFPAVSTAFRQARCRADISRFLRAWLIEGGRHLVPHLAAQQLLLPGLLPHFIAPSCSVEPRHWGGGRLCWGGSGWCPGASQAHRAEAA